MQNRILLTAGVILTLGLSACGGGELEGPPPVATTPTPSPLPTATPPAPLIDAQGNIGLTTDFWVTEPDSLITMDVSGGVSYMPTGAQQQFRVIIPGPVNFNNATLELTVEADAAFVASGASVQALIQRNFGDFGGFFGCPISAEMFAANTMVSLVNCVVSDMGLEAAEGESLRVGIQSPDGESPAGTLTVTNAQVVVGGTPPMPDPNALDLTSAGGWVVEGDGATGPEFSDRGVSYSPTAVQQQLRIVRTAPTGDLNDAEISLTVEADADFVASGVGLQALIQFNQDTFGGFFGCDIASADFVDGAATVMCTATTDSDLNIASGDGGLRIGIQTSGEGTPAGVVTITDFVVAPAGATPPADPNALDLTSAGNWIVEGEGATGPDYGESGVSYSPTALQQQLRVVRPAPTGDLNGAEITLSVDADADFISSGVGLQALIQFNQDTFGGFFGCGIASGDFVDGSATVMCTADTDADLNIASGDGSLRIGIQTSGEGTPAGTVTITNFVVAPASAPAPDPNALDLTATGNWIVEGMGATGPEFSESGVSYSPTALQQQLRIVRAAPTGDLNGATIALTVAADADFVGSGVSLQALIQFNQDTFGGFFGCEIASSAFMEGTASVTCTADTADDLNVASDGGLRIGIQTSGDGTPAGTVTITSFVVTPAAG